MSLVVNGSPVALESFNDFHPTDTLASVLRDRLGYTGLKVACDQGACGACTVLLDGRAVLSCMMLALEADGRCTDCTPSARGIQYSPSPGQRNPIGDN